MKRHGYTAKLNTGDILRADTQRALYGTLKSYFAAVPDVWYAEVCMDNAPRAFVWRTPDSLNVVPIIE